MTRVCAVIAAVWLVSAGCQRARRAACVLNDDTMGARTRIAAAWHSLVLDDTERGAHECMGATRP